MTTISNVPTAAPVAAPAPAAPANAAPRGNGGIQGVVGDLIRSGSAGYEQATKMSGVQADKAAIVPFESVSTATGLLKDKTANIKGVSKATGALHTIGGFAMLIMASNVGSSLKSPGATGVDLGNRVADLIDGKQTAQGWSLGWGVRTGANGEQEPVESGAVGSALDSLGMH